MMKKLFLFLLLQSAVLMGSAQLYHVGDLYTAEDGSQGIVFFVQTDGSGWAVALHDLPTNLPWSPSNLNVPSLNDIGDPFAPVSSTNDFSGYVNTQQIRSTFGMSPNYAAGAVNFNFGWYLPSMYQLCILYAQLPLVETALLNAGGSSLVSSATGTTSGYWSSSEVSTDQAWVVFFTDNPSLSFVVGSGVPQSFTKASPQGQKVRAVHDIPAPNNVYDTTLTYIWNTGSTEPHFFDVPLQNSTYVVTVSNAYGCTNTDSASVMVIDSISLFADRFGAFGMEPKVQAVASVSKANGLIGPIKGARGVYFVQVNNRFDMQQMDPEQLRMGQEYNTRRSIGMTQRGRYLSMDRRIFWWLRSNANVEDHRDIMY